jgi:peptide/nickel transport system substrate-binding protein
MFKLVAMTCLASAMALSIADAQTLRIGLQSDPDALDPDTSRTVAARTVFAALCDKLIEIDAELNYVPQLATSWQWSEDLRSLTLNLREGVVFHDGEPFDAEAVVYNIERKLTLPTSNRRSEISLVTGAEAVDEHTVRLDLSEPFVPLIAALSDRAGMMVSPKAAEAAGEQFALEPVCAGPYRFVERVSLDRIVLEKFDRHWDAGAYPIEQVVFLPINDSTVRLSNLRSGDLHLIEQVAPSDIEIIESQAGIRTVSVPGLGAHYIVINVAGGSQGQSETPLGQSPLVREALELAIDRDALNMVSNEGAFTPGNQAMPPSSPYYIKELPPPARDVERAQALVREAGFDRVPVRLLVPNTTAYQRSAEIIQAMAREANIDVELTTAEVTTTLQQWDDGDFESLIIRWSGRTDPDGNLYSFKACDGNLNGGEYCNPEMDRLLELARTQENYADRYDTYRRLTEIYLTDRPYIYLYHEHYIFGLQDEVQGFTPVPDGLIRLRGVSLGG